MRSVSVCLLLATSYSFAAGCGDVTGDLIVRTGPPPEASACSGDGDCAAPNVRCELTSGACVECLDNSHCGADERCALPANVCVARCVGPESCSGNTPTCELATGLCRACSDDTECDITAPYCQASGACVECLESAHCSSGDDDDDADDDDDDDDDDDALFCNAAGRCVECLDDGHCDDVSEQCSTFLGECARPCSATVACGADDDPICDEGIGFCVECRSDLECEEGEACRGSECVD